MSDRMIVIVILTGAVLFDAAILMPFPTALICLLAVGAGVAVGVAGWIVGYDARYSTRRWPRRTGPRDRQ